MQPHLPIYLSLPPKRHGQKGFTLLETLLYLGLFGLIMVSLTTLGFMAMQHGTQARADLKNQTEADFIGDKLRWLTENNAVVSPMIGQTTDQLVLQTGGSVESTLITIKQKDGQLVIEDNVGQTVPLTAPANRISNLSFELSSQRQLTTNLNLNDRLYVFRQQLWGP